MWAKYVYQEIVLSERIVFINSFSNQAGEITRHPIVPTWPAGDAGHGQARRRARRQDQAQRPLDAAQCHRSGAKSVAWSVSHVGMQATWGVTFDQLARFIWQSDGLARDSSAG